MIHGRRLYRRMHPSASPQKSEYIKPVLHSLHLITLKRVKTGQQPSADRKEVKESGHGVKKHGKSKEPQSKGSPDVPLRRSQREAKVAKP